MSILSREIECGAEQREMGKALRKVADLTFQNRIVLFREEANSVAEIAQPLEQRDGVIMFAEHDVVLDEPAAACEDRSLAGGQPDVGGFAVVAQHEAVDEQV